MCEEILQKSPDYFKQFAKNIKYFVTDQFPSVDTKDQFAYAFHGSQTSLCTLANEKHWHIMISSEKPQKLGYPVPCPYSCFALLIAHGANFQYNGEIFEKLLQAVIYNEKYPCAEVSPNRLKSKLPKVTKVFKRDIASQTDMLTSASIERYLKVSNGIYGGQLSAIIDCFLSGYGSYDAQMHSMIVKFSLNCSDAQCFCYFCTEFTDD